MSIKIQAVDVKDLPFERRPSKADQSILVRSKLDEDAIAAGETDPFGQFAIIANSRDRSKKRLTKPAGKRRHIWYLGA